MIIGYYHSVFFGGGTYFKLSKNSNDNFFKFEYCHSAVPNYIPNAEMYIKTYNTLSFDNERFKNLEKNLKVKNIKDNSYINEIISIIEKTDWERIENEKYSSDNLDDVCWCFYIENDQNKKYFIQGYSVYPNEIESIYNLFKTINKLN